jgi:hypothetical protein
VPKSIQAKALFARCSIFISNFTDKMSGHCLIMADRRNSELHSGAAAFEAIDNSKWLPATYEVVEVLLDHMKLNFTELLGEARGRVATEMLKDRRDTIKKEVQGKLAAARKYYEEMSPEVKAERTQKVAIAMDAWIKKSLLRRTCKCPACGMTAAMNGETVDRSPVRVEETSGTITREVRVLPNALRCPNCKIALNGYQEMHEAGLGAIYTIEEEEDPIKFFGIVPEEYVDVEELVRQRLEDMEGYNNE